MLGLFPLKKISFKEIVLVEQKWKVKVWRNVTVKHFMSGNALVTEN